MPELSKAVDPKVSDLGEPDSAMPSTTSSRIFSVVSEAAIERSAATIFSTIWTSPSKKPSTAKRPNSKFRDGNSAMTAKGPVQRARHQSRHARVAKGPDRCGSSRGSSVSRAHAANAMGRDESSQSPALPVRVVNASIGNEPSPYTSRPVLNQVCACAFQTRENTGPGEAHQAISM